MKKINLLEKNLKTRLERLFKEDEIGLEINGTLVNYYFHCKRQCYLCGNRLNLEDNSESVKVGRALHKEKEEKKVNSEMSVDNIKIDGLTSKYLVEIKKSDADIEASQWQLLYYLKKFKDKGVVREGKLEIIEKNKQDRGVIYVKLTEEKEKQLEKHIREIEKLIAGEKIPDLLNSPSCKKCAYYEYCYI